MFDTFGERYRDDRGGTYIVIEPHSPGQAALLLDDFDILEERTNLTWDPIASDQITNPVRIEDNPEMTSIVRECMERRREEQEIFSRVPPAQHRVFFNAFDDAQNCTARIMKAQSEAANYSRIRANALQKMVDILGSQPPVAKLLGINQSTLSRALRHQDS